MSPSPDDRLTTLLQEVETLRSELDEVRGQRKDHGVARQRKSAKAWLLVPVLVLSSWVLSAQTPPSISVDIEKRLSALEGLIRKGPSGATQVSAPFAVTSPDGKVLLRVQNDNQPSNGAVVIWRAAGFSSANVSIVSENGKASTELGTTKSGAGIVMTSDATGKTRTEMNGKGKLLVFDEAGNKIAGVVEEQGRGRVAVWHSDTRVASMDADAENGNAGSLAIMSSAGKVLAMLGARAQGGSAGAVSVMNASGTPVAGLTSGQGGGAVVVTNSGGVGLAEMSVSSDGRGLLQVFGRGGRPVAVLTQSQTSPGGLLQISNTGTPVANITVGTTGGGYFQLTNASGEPTLEAGTLPDGRGNIRVGPLWKCTPVQVTAMGMQVGFIDCLMGRVK